MYIHLKPIDSFSNEEDIRNFFFDTFEGLKEDDPSLCFEDYCAEDYYLNDEDGFFYDNQTGQIYSVNQMFRKLMNKHCRAEAV